MVNKIDKPSARPAEVVDEVLELFIELGADDDQLDFPVVYASAINGTSSMSDDPADQEHTMAPIFDTIIDHIPAPERNHLAAHFDKAAQAAGEAQAAMPVFPHQIAAAVPALALEVHKG